MTTAPRKPRAGSGRYSGAPTIADVAALAGVSTMTVSRVINAESNVRDSTREAVNAAIVQLNYAPNRAARSLAGASQLRLGLLYSNPSAAYLSEFLVGSLDQAGRSDIQLVVQKCEIGDHEREVVERMIASGIDGVILPPPLCDSRPVLDVLIAAHVPTVVVATGCPPPECAAISIDDHGAAREMTRHLIELGHALGAADHEQPQRAPFPGPRVLDQARPRRRRLLERLEILRDAVRWRDHLTVIVPEHLRDGRDRRVVLRARPQGWFLAEGVARQE